MFVILACYSGLITYLSVFQPEILSKNIKVLAEQRERFIIYTVCFGISLLWLTLRINENLNFVTQVLLELTLIQVALIDTYSKIIPNRLLLLVLFFGLISLSNNFIDLNWFKIGVVLFTTLSAQILSIKLLKKKLFGWGDVKLIMVITLIYEPNILGILILSFFTAGLFGGALILVNKGTLKTQIPLSPFIIATALILSLLAVTDKNLILNLF